jgi:Ca2+-binding EF-hand superfamily protein
LALLALAAGCGAEPPQAPVVLAPSFLPVPDRFEARLVDVAKAVVELPPPVRGFEFGAWDRDGDLVVGERELRQGFAKVQKRWNRDRRPGLSLLELSDGVFVTWDLDFDGALDPSEFALVSERWFRVAMTFERWDHDADRRITVLEWRAGYRTSHAFHLLDEDHDGSVTRRELVRAYRVSWDDDQDERLSSDEWPSL